MMTTAIQIENLKCGGCAATIIKGLTALENVTEVTVDVEKSVVSITSTNEKMDLIQQKLSKLGYPVIGDKNTTVHKIKSFVSCAIGRIDA